MYLELRNPLSSWVESKSDVRFDRTPHKFRAKSQNRSKSWKNADNWHFSLWEQSVCKGELDLWATQSRVSSKKWDSIRRVIAADLRAREVVLPLQGYTPARATRAVELSILLVQNIPAYYFYPFVKESSGIEWGGHIEGTHFPQILFVNSCRRALF